MPVGDVKVGLIVFIRECPCKISHIVFSKTGKHGAAKAIMTGVDILTDKKHSYSSNTSDKIPIPKIEKYSWQLMNNNE